MIGNAGYPDYMYNDNMTKLENLYEEVIYRKYFALNIYV